MQDPAADSTPAYVFGSFGPVVLGSWRDRASLEGVASFRRTCEAVRRRFGKLAILATAEAFAPPPDAAGRAAIAAAFREVDGVSLGAAFLIEGEGFRASMLRSITTGLFFVAGRQQKAQVLSTALEAAEWVCGRLVEGGVLLSFDAAVLAGQLGQLREMPVQNQTMGRVSR